MAYWHELSRLRLGISRCSVNNQAMQFVLPGEQNPEIFEAHYRRKEVQEQTEHIGYLEGWMQLWPLDPITAPTAEEARDKALPLLEVVASKSRDELFEKRACPVLLSHKKVDEIRSPTHLAFAWIFKHAETRYEVRYFGAIVGNDEEEGWRLYPEVEGMAVPKGFEMLTLADGLESAIQIAASELKRIVSTGEIKAK